jgi:MYXO-CTERM domain-containing protein
VVTDAAAQTLADDNPHFTQIGLLRGAIEFTDVPIIYLDDVVEGDSLADVRPDPVGPSMMDGGVPDGSTPDASLADSGGADTGTPPPDASVDASADSSMGVEDDGGCGCRSTGDPRGVPVDVGLVLLVLLGARREWSKT